MPALNLEQTFDQCEALVADPSFPSVREWKRKHPGGRAVAFFPVYAPVEIIHACGMLPVGLTGAGDQLDIQYADARFGSFICSIVKTTLELGLTGHLEPFDGFLFSSICDSARNLCFVLKRNFQQLYIDFLHLPHGSPSANATEFLASEYRRLISSLEQLNGCAFNEERLRHSIALYNENRRLLRRLSQVRAEEPHRLRASEFYVLLRAGNLLPVETHNEWLREALAELPTRSGKPRDSLRVVVEGAFCEQPPRELVRLLEEAGCYVVDDDFGLGQRWFTSDVPSDGDPVLGLAESYGARSVYSSVRHDPSRPRTAGLIEKVRRSNAAAVIFLIAKFCEPAYFDYVLFKRELEILGIPHLLLEFEEKMFTFDRVRTEIETFVESLMFG